MFSRRSKQTAEGLADLHGCAVHLLDLLKRKLPDKCGEKSGWNFEKAHSILHKVREIVMWGNSDNTSCQSAEHAHIDLIKAVASCTNNKDVFMCILRFHARRGYLQHYQTLLKELAEEAGAEAGADVDPSGDSYAHDSSLLGDRNFNVACETGIRYPAYETMCRREEQYIRISVLFIVYTVFIHYIYIRYIYPIFFVQADGKSSSGVVNLDIDLLKPFRVAAAQSDSGSRSEHSPALVQRTQPMDKMWLEYAYRKSHPVLQFLPTKLAEWIGENMQDELGFPDKRDPNKWSVSELNYILRNHVVRGRNSGSLRTFGCVEWESELCRGIMRARCYPFNLPGHRFHKMNIQVSNNSYT